MGINDDDIDVEIKACEANILHSTGDDDTTKQALLGPLSVLFIEIEKFRSIPGSPLKNLSSCPGYLKIDVM